MPALLAQSLFSDLRTQLTSAQLLCTLHVEGTVISCLGTAKRTNTFVASKIANNMEIVNVTCKMYSWHTKEKQPRGVQR